MSLDGKQVLVGNPLVVAPKRQPHYVADFALAARPYALSKMTVATNTRTQLAVAYHPVTATKNAYLRKCTFALESVSAAGLYVVELMGVVSIPVTGNPPITIASMKRGGSSELIAMALPTTAANDLGAATRISRREFNLGVTAAVPTTNPPAPLNEVVLFEYQGEGQEPPCLRAATLEGWAIIIDITPAATIKCFARMEFWEESP
jgi:hypothetical protein